MTELCEMNIISGHIFTDCILTSIYTLVTQEVTSHKVLYKNLSMSCLMADNIKTYLKEIGYKDVDWVHMANDRVQWMVFVNMITNPQFPLRGGEFLHYLSDY